MYWRTGDETIFSTAEPSPFHRSAARSVRVQVGDQEEGAMMTLFGGRLAEHSWLGRVRRRYVAPAAVMSGGLLLAAVARPAEAQSVPANPSDLRVLEEGLEEGTDGACPSPPESPEVDYIVLSFIDRSTNETQFKIQRQSRGPNSSW